MPVPGISFKITEIRIGMSPQMLTLLLSQLQYMKPWHNNVNQSFSGCIPRLGWVAIILLITATFKMLYIYRQIW